MECNYNHVHSTVSYILSTSRDRISGTVADSLEQYNQIIERHFMDESDIAKLCQQIYENHQQALDLIFEHRPDMQNQIAEQLIETISQTQGLDIDTNTKSIIRFTTSEFELLPSQHSGDGTWTPSNRVLLFELINQDYGVFIKLIIGPSTDQKFRELIFNKAKNSNKIKGKKNLTPKWASIHRYDLINKDELNDLTNEGVLTRILKRWDGFISELIIIHEELIDD